MVSVSSEHRLGVCRTCSCRSREACNCVRHIYLINTMPDPLTRFSPYFHPVVRGVQDELDGGGDAGGELALRHLLARRVRPHRRPEVRHPTAEDRAGTPFNALSYENQNESQISNGNIFNPLMYGDWLQSWYVIW